MKRDSGSDGIWREFLRVEIPPESYPFFGLPVPPQMTGPAQTLVVSAVDRERGIVTMSVSDKNLLPTFANEDEEREFWSTHDATDYFDSEHVQTNPDVRNLRKSDEPSTS